MFRKQGELEVELGATNGGTHYIALNGPSFLDDRDHDLDCKMYEH
jgi:hypothetical protein